MWFTFSILTIIAWGGSDLFSKQGTRPEDKFSHHRIVIIVGAVMGLHGLGYIMFTQTVFDPVSIIRYLPVSALYIGSMAIGYAGLRYIELSVSSPICNSSGAVTAILCFVVLKQTMAPIQLLGVAVICVGILLLSIFEKRKSGVVTDESDRKYTKSVIAILFPILYCIIDGAGSFTDAWYLENIMDESQANLAYEFTFAICGALSYLYLTRLRKEKFSFFKEKSFCAAAICETAGQFTYIYAMGDNAIVAAPMIASYSIFSVVLSRIFLKEKLSRSQYAAIGMVMMGIAILGFFE